MKKIHDEAAALIPWYANGSLADEERTAVDVHIAQCSECRSLLDEAILLMTGGLDTERVIAGFEASGDSVAGGAPGRLEGHPQAQILREYADGSQRLGVETAVAVRSHLAHCEACRSAVEAAAAVGEEASAAEAAAAHDRGGPAVSPLHAPPARPAAGPSAGLWAWLSGTLLQPVPAAAYLLLLLIALPVVLVRQPPATTGAAPGAGVVAPGILPPPLTITGERVFRQRPDEGPAPIALDLPSHPGATVQLALKTRIDREDLDDPDAMFEVLIERQGEPVWSTTTDGSRFSADRELRLLLPAGLLRGDPTAIIIRLVKPGDPLHGAELFRRTIEAP